MMHRLIAQMLQSMHGHHFYSSLAYQLLHQDAAGKTISMVDYSSLTTLMITVHVMQEG